MSTKLSKYIRVGQNFICEDGYETKPLNFQFLKIFLHISSLQCKSIQPCTAICFHIDKCLRLQIVKMRILHVCTKGIKTTRKFEVHDPNHGFSDFVLAATHFVNNEFYSPNTES